MYLLHYESLQPDKYFLLREFSLAFLVYFYAFLIAYKQTKAAVWFTLVWKHYHNVTCVYSVYKKLRKHLMV